jgi:hypothetical protein
MKRRFLQRTTLVSFLALWPTTGALSADYFPPPDSAGGWRTLTDAGEIRTKAGVDLNRLDEAKWRTVGRAAWLFGL